MCKSVSLMGLTSITNEIMQNLSSTQTSRLLFRMCSFCRFGSQKPCWQSFMILQRTCLFIITSLLFFPDTLWHLSSEETEKGGEWKSRGVCGKHMQSGEQLLASMWSVGLLRWTLWEFHCCRRACFCTSCQQSFLTLLNMIYLTNIKRTCDKKYWDWKDSNR